MSSAGRVTGPLFAFVALAGYALGEPSEERMGNHECPSGFNMAARLSPGYQQAWRPFMLALQASVARPALLGKM